ncbi:hypothetical protein Tco_0937147 [Tanacetum coccineum]|uniref:Reverse transcriptase zinc-binding domain-containing protein n=1 Tax=Tanacetum coccineum TaxID=301880 RepID=A0ABQ5DEK1_9ASTR
MHIDWASMFVLPSRVLLDVEQIMRGFLWCQGLLKKGKANVSWDIVCRKRIEGVLGVRRLDTFNKALMVSHLWNLISSKESEFIWYRIGDGLTASAWFDSWCHVGPISRIVTSRDIFRAGYDLSTKYPMLCSIIPPIFSDIEDRLEWRNINGLVKPFSVSNVWDCIRPHFEIVPWHDVVWFNNCVPRFSLLLWTVIHGKLKTQDLLRHWDVNTRLVSSCSLCGDQPDSNNHLFFKCGYSTQVWDHMKDLAALSNVVGGYKDVVDFLSSYANRRSCKSVIAKLVFSASVYYIWHERNARLFSNQKRSSIQLTEIITSVIRLKLITCSFKKTRPGLEFARLWKLPESIFRSNTRRCIALVFVLFGGFSLLVSLSVL